MTASHLTTPESTICFSFSSLLSFVLDMSNDGQIVSPFARG